MIKRLFALNYKLFINGVEQLDYTLEGNILRSKTGVFYIPETTSIIAAGGIISLELATTYPDFGIEVLALINDEVDGPYYEVLVYTEESGAWEPAQGGQEVGHVLSWKYCKDIKL